MRVSNSIIFDTAIDDLEWKNPIDFGENRKNQNGRQQPFCENMMKKLVFHVTATPIHVSNSYLTAIDDLEWKNPIDFGENRKTKMAANSHFVKIMMKKLVHSIT